MKGKWEPPHQAGQVWHREQAGPFGRAAYYSAPTISRDFRLEVFTKICDQQTNICLLCWNWLLIDVSFFKCASIENHKLPCHPYKRARCPGVPMCLPSKTKCPGGRKYWTLEASLISFRLQHTFYLVLSESVNGTSANYCSPNPRKHRVINRRDQHPAFNISDVSCRR